MLEIICLMKSTSLQMNVCQQNHYTSKYLQNQKVKISIRNLKKKKKRPDTANE